MKLNILGSEWTLVEANSKEDAYLSDNYGYCDSLVRKIVIAKQDSIEVKPETPEDMAEVLRLAKCHEIIHAFLFEAGLGYSSAAPGAWAVNEEMVDWFAKQWPKIQAAFVEAGCAA